MRVRTSCVEPAGTSRTQVQGALWPCTVEAAVIITVTMARGRRTASCGGPGAG